MRSAHASGQWQASVCGCAVLSGPGAYYLGLVEKRVFWAYHGTRVRRGGGACEQGKHGASSEATKSARVCHVQQGARDGREGVTRASAAAFEIGDLAVNRHSRKAIRASDDEPCCPVLAPWIERIGPCGEDTTLLRTAARIC